MKKTLILTLLLGLNSYAQTPQAPQHKETGEELDVSQVTEKYWAQGKDSELGVVQNRKYTSEHKLELSLLTGTVSTDPFLSVTQFGGSLGYYVSPYFSIHAIAWKDSVSDSDAYLSFKARTTNAALDRNRPKSFYGLQLNQNFLYGKASLFGKAIIYVDIFALGGLGVTNTESGNSATPFIGIGQKIHLNQYFSLNLDYRIMRFNETILSSTGGKSNERINTTDVISAGIGFLY